MDRLRSFLNLERGEEVPALLLFLYLTLALTAYIIAKAVRDGLFLIKFSALMLPYVYIGIGLVMGFVVSFYVRLSSRYSQATLISCTLIFFILTIAAQWWAVRMEWSPIPWVFYVWTSMFGIIITVQVWTVANSVLDLRQAKRLFPLVSSGGILGSALGGLLGAALVKFTGTDHLILILIPLLALSIILVQVLTRRYGQSSRGSPASTAEGETRKDFKTLFHAIMTSPYLKLIVALLALSAIVTLIVGFQFDVIVQRAFRSKDQITAFKASFGAFFSLLSFFLQIVAGSRIVEKFQLRVTLLILPLALLGGTGVLLAFPFALWAGIVLKGTDHTLRYSIDKATTELLYAPLPQSLKAEVKAIIDMVGQRLADGVAGLLLLLVTRLFHAGQVGVGIFNLGLLGVWLWVALRTRKEYVSVIRANLSARPELPKGALVWAISDAKSIASLRAMFEAKDEEVVLYAIDAALKMGKKEWIPAKLVAHPSPRVRLKALEIVPMAEHEILDWVRKETDSTVRPSGIMKACKVVRPGEPRSALVQFLHDRDLKVRLSALVCVAQDTSEQGTQTLKDELGQITSQLDEASEKWKDVAEVLGEIRHPAAIDLHIRLLKHPRPRVRKEAIRSAARVQQRELVPFLVRLLADREVSAEARRALQEWGPRILGTLADILRDPREDIEVRRNIPLVLAYIASQEAVDLLLECLFDFDGLLRYRAIRALGKLRAIDPGLRVDPEKVGLCIREECEKTLRYEQALACLYAQGDNSDLLAQLLKDKISYGRERVFRLLGLMLPQRDAYACFLALRENDRLKKAHLIEYLDNVLPGQVKESVLPLVETKKSESKEVPDVATILGTFMKSPDTILRDCAADAVAKGRWPEVSRTNPTLR